MSFFSEWILVFVGPTVYSQVLLLMLSDFTVANSSVLEVGYSSSSSINNILHLPHYDSDFPTKQLNF